MDIINSENVDNNSIIDEKINRDEAELKKYTAWEIIETVMKEKSGFWRVEYVHASGHGWQNINHWNSKAQLHFDINKFYNDFNLTDKSWDDFVKVFGEKNISHDQSKLVLENQETRYALKNKEKVLNHLRQLLLELFKEEKERIQTEISEFKKQERLDEKWKHSEKKSRRKKWKNISIEDYE